MKHIFILLILIISLTGTAQNASNDFRNHKLPLEQRVDILLQQLTLDEKLAFMEHQNPAIERLDIPAYSWWNEALHGVARNGFATVYPEPIAIAATFDTAAVEQMYALIGDEGRLKYRQSQKSGLTGDNTGITFFTPNINLFRDPRWGRGMETFGEDPYLTAQMGKACVNGLQGNHPFYYKTRIEFEDAYKGAVVGIGSQFIFAKHYGVSFRTGISSRGFNMYSDPSPDAAAEPTTIGASTIDWFIGGGLEYHWML